MFLYYLINIWKTKQSWLKKTLSALPGWPTCACSYGKFSSRLDGMSARSSEISPWQAGSLLIWTHYIFIRVSLMKVSPRRANPPNRAISPPYKQPLNGKCLRLIYNDKHSTCHELLKKHCSFLFILKTCNFLTWKCINKLKVSL